MSDKTEVHKITVLVVDHDHLGADRVMEAMENVSYPNRCLSPTPLSCETQEVDWSDEHPLNKASTYQQEVERLFSPCSESSLLKAAQKAVRALELVRFDSLNMKLSDMDEIREAYNELKAVAAFPTSVGKVKEERTAELSQTWSNFVHHLNTVQPIKGDHKNFLGSIQSYQKLFMEGNLAWKPE